MPLRDIFLTLCVYGSVPFILRDPYWGVLVWNWLAFMNPHRYTWDFAFNMRFSLVVGLATLLSFVFHGGLAKIPWRAAPVILMGLLLGWVGVTTIMALNPAGAYVEWDRFSKIMVMVFVALAAVDSRKRLDWLVWVVVLSLGFFGFKGGIFTIAHGGVYRVGGPKGSFIEDNNALGFALVICLPLMRYLQLQATNRKIKIGLGVLMFLTGCSILGSHSRGAFLAAAGMVVMLWLRSRRKLVFGLAMALAIPFMLSVMPPQWTARMKTIETYQEDDSALGRINAWKFAWNLAVDHPILGGGANVFTAQMFRRYAPEPERVHDSHSIYFEILAEQGFVGLAIFLAIGFTTWFYASNLMRRTRGHATLGWAYDLAAMCKVALVGYALGGAFLGLAYFDLPYTIVAMIVIASRLVDVELASEAAKAPVPVRPARPAPGAASLRRLGQAG